jgi:hypothetical protein
LNVEQPMPSARGIETFFNYEKFEDEENSLNMTDQNFSMSDQTYNTNEIIDTSAPPLN